MVSVTKTAALSGLDGFAVTVESFSEKGSLPVIEIIGLPDVSVREALERIHAACSHNELPFYKGRTTVNLAPADKKKIGSAFDLAILISLLKQNLLAETDLSQSCFIGELSLSGAVRRARGVLPLTLAARADGAREVFVPAENAAEASVVDGITVYGVGHIRELISHLKGEVRLSPAVFSREEANKAGRSEVDLSEIRGQVFAKRALEIAAAGNLNLLLIGPPGAGKSMLAKAMCGILPPMAFSEMLETTKIHSVSGTLESGVSLLSSRPFRAPHHTLSVAGLAGGGTNPMPGEISLAHNGVLFLDELPEFEKRAREILRQPLEDRRVTITRAGAKVTFPARFLLVCAMNPCPCGYYGSEGRTCTCTQGAVEKYLGKVSGPFLDRMDLQVEVPAVAFSEITAPATDAEDSATVRARVVAAREFAQRRLRASGVLTNGDMSAAQTKASCVYSASAGKLLEQAFERLHLSARGYDRILRVARTIADLAESETIEDAHILEAIQMRSLDRKYFDR